MIREFSQEYGVPFEASRGGAETMYPEYRKKLKQMEIPRAKVFDVQFEQEHKKPGRRPNHEDAALLSWRWSRLHPVSTAAGRWNPYEVRHVQGNVYMFASTLGNVTIQVGKDAGHDGVLLVDTGAPQLRETLLAEIHKLSAEPVRFIINTSADADHIGSNEVLLKPSRDLPTAGRSGAIRAGQRIAAREPRWIGRVRPARGRR